MDAHKNFAKSLVATAPSPASSGTSLVVTAGEGALFPAVPFNVTIWPAGVQPTAANAEIARVTAISTDTFTIARAQEGSSARTVVVGDQIAATITNKTLTDIEALSAPIHTGSGTDASAGATNLDTFSPAGLLTAIDGLFIVIKSVMSAGTTTGQHLYNSTDSVQVSSKVNIGTNIAFVYERVECGAGSTTKVGSTQLLGGVTPTITRSTFTTAWPGATIALRHDGVSGGTLSWEWAIYRSLRQ